MPPSGDNTLRDQLQNGQITAVSIDTTVFHSLCRSGNLDNPIFRQLGNLSTLSLRFILSEVVLNEAHRHFEKACRETAQALKKALRGYAGAWKGNRDLVVQVQADGRLANSPDDAAAETIKRLIDDFKPEILDFDSGINIGELFSNYFGGRRPFTASDKKAQFPDAVALSSLGAWAETNGSVLVVSNDGEWKSFCDESEHLFAVATLQEALELIKEGRPKPEPTRNLLTMFMADLSLGVQNEPSLAIHSAIERSLEESAFADASSPFSIDAELDWVAIQHLLFPSTVNEVQILSLNETSLLFVMTVVAELDASASFSFFNNDEGEETVFATKSANRSLSHDFEVSVQLVARGSSYEIEEIEVVPDTSLRRVQFDDQNPYDED